jgi:hypothetical protein
MYSEYVIGIAFPLQQRLRERASLLRYAYIASLIAVAPRPLNIFVKITDGTLTYQI